MSNTFSALILAAGKGVRMKSALPKVLHPILGKPMVQYVIEKVREAGANECTVVVGYGKEALTQALAGTNVGFVEQPEQLGTGHAVQCYAKAFPHQPEHLLVVCGDTPLLSASTLQELVACHFRDGNHLTMMTLTMNNPGGYGRIIRNSAGKAVAIRENKDCTPEEKQIKETNLAVYLFAGKTLYKYLPRLQNRNQQKEYYLTDVVAMLAEDNGKIGTISEADERSTLGINSRSDLAQVSGILQRQILESHMAAGVTIVSPEQTFISPDVRIGADTTVWPGTVITGTCEIGEGCLLGPHTMIASSTIGRNACLQFSVVENATIAPDTRVVPYTHIRAGEQSQK
jgi:bifunctional UDP-N-acetylglucosamine pyrophosphorylase/glucosamine-1-phosphate N-acetyltransferase